jgi:hypothetical protein
VYFRTRLLARKQQWHRLPGVGPVLLTVGAYATGVVAGLLFASASEREALVNVGPFCVFVFGFTFAVVSRFRLPRGTLWWVAYAAVSVIVAVLVYVLGSAT